MFRSPSQASLPPWSWMVEDLPVHRDKLARHLGLSPRMLQRYDASDQAPRVVQLAVFWETRWGRYTADAEAARAADVFRAHAHGTERENAALRRRIARMEEELMQARPLAANLPFYLV